MARSQAGATLTAQHRGAQLELRARALRDYTRLWPVWRGDAASFNALVNATVPLVTAYHQLSSATAGDYFRAFRTAEQAGGSATPVIGPGVDRDKLVSSLIVTGRITVGKAIAGGQSPQAAMRTALARTSGSVVRHVLQGGRDTLVLSTGRDRQALGWSRVTSGTPCAFCAMLASRGPVFHGEDTAEFEAHDACACTAEPAYQGSELPPASAGFRDAYNQAQRDAAAAGDLERGTSNDALNAFRRSL